MMLGYTATLRRVSQASAIRIDVPGDGPVSGALHVPDKAARALFALAPGAGTTMQHPSIVALAEGLAARGVTVLRFNFPYAERGSRRIDAKPKLLAAYRAAADALADSRRGRERPRTPRSSGAGRGKGKLILGGRSMGGRMASMLVAEGYACDGLVFFGYPLHPAGRPDQLRDAHLPSVRPPMLFLQGTRDALCDLDLLRPVLARLGPRATLHEVAGADHSFAVRKSDGRTPESVLEEILSVTADWIGKVAVG